ncbi:MAG: septum formation initiator family protein [Oscillospiraceae bacterium]|nr:septum formation initiator family protein [Oscillospiraceae bacterium]
MQERNVARGNNAAKGKKRKKTRTTEGLAKMALVCLMVVFAVSIISTQFEIASVKRETAHLRAQISDTRAQNEETQAILDSEDDKDFIERMAREKLGYIYPGEQVYSDISGS